MSIIADKLKDAKEIHQLVELDFDGLIKRYAHRNIIVPDVYWDEQDLLTYNETDGPGKVTITENQITLTNGDRDEDYYVTYDFGIGYFTNFTHWVDVNVTSLTDHVFSGFACWALSNADDDLKDIDDANGDALFIWPRSADATHYLIEIYNLDAGAINSIDTSSAIAVNTLSYLAISRSGTTITCEIYSSAALRIAGGAGDVDTISGTVINTAFRYLYGLGSYSAAQAGKDISGIVSNLRLAGSGNEKLFEGSILNKFEVSQTFDITGPKYSLGNVQIDIANKNRFQDEEKVRRLDGGVGKIYIWCEGLTWHDIEEAGLMFRGIFRKNYHDKFVYSFSLVDPIKAKSKELPENTITTDTWANHRTEGGGGSVAGKSEPLLLGNWLKAIPLLCVDTAAFKYLACVGVVESVDADYTAGTVDVYDKDGGVIAPAGYTFYPGGIDEQGNVIAYFDFAGDQVANEPLSCSIEALDDNEGIYGGDLIEHPANIIYYLWNLYMNFVPGDIHVGSIRTMRSLLPGLKFASMVNSIVDGVSLSDRILSQCQCARIQRNGKAGIMPFDFDPIDIQRLKRFDLIGKTVRITKTPEDILCNDLKISYAPNPTTKQWEGEIIRNRTNNPDCEKSYNEYGIRPQRELFLTDIQQEDVAVYCADRYLKIRAFRHDIVECGTSYWESFDTLEGDGSLLTVEEGSSLDGDGWVDEPFILLERKFGFNTIHQKWWRIGVK